MVTIMRHSTCTVVQYFVEVGRDKQWYTGTVSLHPLNTSYPLPDRDVQNLIKLVDHTQKCTNRCPCWRHEKRSSRAPPSHNFNQHAPSSFDFSGLSTRVIGRASAGLGGVEPSLRPITPGLATWIMGPRWPRNLFPKFLARHANTTASSNFEVLRTQSCCKTAFPHVCNAKANADPGHLYSREMLAWQLSNRCCRDFAYKPTRLHCLAALARLA